MKVLLINGSCNRKGCTFTALSEVQKVLESHSIETEIIQVGNKPVVDCIGCGQCKKNEHKCIFNDDIVNEIIEKAKDADGFIFGSPVYYAHPSGRLLSVMDRLFVAGSKYFAHKPAAAVASARRGGTTATLDAINKHFTYNEMPVVSSTYWNMVHGNTPEEVMQDLEGLRIMRSLGENMAWLLKCIDLGKKNGINEPTTDRSVMTNFIR